MNAWIKYNKETRQQIESANAIAILHNSGSTKTVIDKESMLHYVKYDCSFMIQAFRLL